MNNPKYHLLNSLAYLCLLKPYLNLLFFKNNFFIPLINLLNNLLHLMVFANHEKHLLIIYLYIYLILKVNVIQLLN